MHLQKINSNQNPEVTTNQAAGFFAFAAGGAALICNDYYGNRAQSEMGYRLLFLLGGALFHSLCQNVAKIEASRVKQAPTQLSTIEILSSTIEILGVTTLAASMLIEIPENAFLPVLYLAGAATHSICLKLWKKSAQTPLAQKQLVSAKKQDLNWYTQSLKKLSQPFDDLTSNLNRFKRAAEAFNRAIKDLVLVANKPEIPHKNPEVRVDKRRYHLPMDLLDYYDSLRYNTEPFVYSYQNECDGRHIYRHTNLESFNNDLKYSHRHVGWGDWHMNDTKELITVTCV